MGDLYVINTCNSDDIQCTTQISSIQLVTAVTVFLALLCASAQQSSCHGVGVRRPSVRRPLVIRPSNSFLGNALIPYLVERCTSSISPDYFCLFFKLVNFDFFYDICFIFVNIRPYGSKRFKRHILWKYTPDLLPKMQCILLGKVSTKVVKTVEF